MPGEVSSPTYLRPKLPAPYARQRLTANELSTRTPESAARTSVTRAALEFRAELR